MEFAIALRLLFAGLIAIVSWLVPNTNAPVLTLSVPTSIDSELMPVFVLALGSVWLTTVAPAAALPTAAKPPVAVELAATAAKLETPLPDCAAMAAKPDTPLGDCAATAAKPDTPLEDCVATLAKMAVAVDCVAATVALNWPAVEIWMGGVTGAIAAASAAPLAAASAVLLAWLRRCWAASSALAAACVLLVLSANDETLMMHLTSPYG